MGYRRKKETQRRQAAKSRKRLNERQKTRCQRTDDGRSYGREYGSE